MVRQRDVVVLMMGAALVTSAAVASGQLELAVIQGTVVDEEGRPLEGVTLRLHDLDRGRETVITSDKNGRFYRRGLQAVEYEIVVEKEGYQPIQDRLKLSAGVDRRFNFKLARASPAGAEEFVSGVDAFNRGDMPAAVQAFEAALLKAPEAPEVRVNLALAYMRLSRHDEAIAQLEQAAALIPDEPRVLFQLGGAYVEARENDKAIDALEKGLAAQPDLTDPLVYEATVTLGAVYFATGEIERAIARFEQATAARPDAPAPKLGLGKCAFSKGEVDQALRYFKQVVASAPGTPEAAEADAFIKEIEKKQRPESPPDRVAGHHA